MEQTRLLGREELLACVDLGKALTAELDQDKLLRTIMLRLSELLPAENWSLLLWDEASQELAFKLAVDLDLDQVKDVRLRPGQGIAGQAALSKRPLLIEDVAACPFFNDAVDRLTGFRTQAVMAVPLLFGGRCLGVMEVVNPRRVGPESLALLSLVTDYAAIAVENTRRYRRIEELAVHDDLTGLYNTRHLYRALSELLAQGRPVALIFLDMDNFKRVVDAHGHLNGSRALAEVAATIRTALPAGAWAVAYGGDEFVAVLPGADKAQAVEVAEAIRASIKATTYLLGQGLAVRLQVSIGLAACPEDAADLEGLLALADRAMFKVKGQGKDGVGVRP